MKKAKSSATPEQAAAVALRDELLAQGWPTSVEVGLANGGGLDNPAQWAQIKRDAGELLGVWSLRKTLGGTRTSSSFRMVAGIHASKIC